MTRDGAVAPDQRGGDTCDHHVDAGGLAARKRAFDRAPSVASAMPRGLSITTAGVLIAAARRASSARPLGPESCGPAKMIGRAAAAIAASTASATAVVSSGAAGDPSRASGQTMALLSTR